MTDSPATDHDTDPEHTDPDSADRPDSTLPREYPRQWAADVLASDGGVVHIRPIVPADADQLVEFHNGLSERTRYMRYFGPTPTLPPREVVRMTTVDYRSRVALLAFLGDRVIAMGLYEGLAADGKPDSAEVAFVVADDHQGRGLGPILLEHLAGAAAENGFTRFEAEVLSENPNMVAVFRDAGYQVSRAFDGSTVHVEFLIDPTEALTVVRNARERASEARSIANLLRPQSVAVIGASTDPKKVGNVLLANVLAAGFTGPVFPVNGPGLAPDAAETDTAENPHSHHYSGPIPPTRNGPGVTRQAPPSVRGIRSYPTVRDIPDPIDLAVVAVPAAGMDRVLDDCLAKGVRTLVVVSAGFGERGEAGLENEKRLAEQVRAHGMRLVGPNALGVVNNHHDIALNASLAPRIPGTGRVGFFCQSGALGIAILDTAAHRRLGLSTFVSAGNRADVSGNDVLQYWDTDDDTDVVLLYLESFGNPRKFSRIARRVASRKPIVAIKSGSGAMSPVHAQRTGPVRDDRVAQMVLEQAGVIQVETIAELFDCAAVLAYQPLPSGPRTAILGNSSVIASLAANTARSSGLEVVSSVDLGPAATHSALTAAVADAMADDDIDAVIVVFVPPVAVEATDYAFGLLEATRPVDGGDIPTKPVVTTFLAVEGVPPGLSRTGPDGLPVRGSIPSYPTPERAASALAQAWRYARWRARPDAEPIPIPDTHPEDARGYVREIMDRSDPAQHSPGQPAAGQPGDRRLTPSEAAYVLGRFGIDVVPFRDVSTMHEASAAARELGFPVVVKSSSPQWVGRVDREGARLDLADATAVITAFNELQELTGGANLQVQRMASKGVGIYLSVSDSPSFGPLISFGLSGRLFEALGDRSFRSIPMTEHDARELVVQPSVRTLLAEDDTDPDSLVDLLQRVSALIEAVPEIRELTLDPILTSPDGPAILGSQIRVGPVPTLADTGPRRLG